MSWWSKVFGAKAETSPAQQVMDSPVTVDLIPGALKARVYSHALPGSSRAFPCWTYVSDGLRSRGQRELAITVKCLPEERVTTYPQEPLQLFETFMAFAERGQVVGAGGYTEFGQRKPFGRHLCYLDPFPMEGVPLPENCLTALFVTPEELAAVKAFGVTRVAAQLGLTERFFPYPPWLDRQRGSLSFGSMSEKSILSRMNSLSVPGVSVSQEGADVVMRVYPSGISALQQFIAAVPEGGSPALLTKVDPSADSCFVWSPGQAEPAAISAPGATGGRIAGCFVAFIAEQPSSSARLFEDGFAVTLADSDWSALRTAIAGKRGFAFPHQQSELGFRLEWPS